MTPIEKITKLKSEIRLVVHEKELDDSKYARMVTAIFSPGRHTIEGMNESNNELRKLARRTTKQYKQLVELGAKLIKTYPECESLIIR